MFGFNTKMKNGREKVGDGTDHKISPADFRVPKAKRLALPFGKPDSTHPDKRDFEHEHYIREIPLSGGGLGCALWDGGLVLTRWIYHNGAIFSNRSVLELGCGVGLAGIMAAHWAKSVTLTDYIDETVQNALYNASINSEEDFDDDEEPSVLPVVSGAPYSRDIKGRIRARMLDWDAEATGNSIPSYDGPYCTAIELAASGEVVKRPAVVQEWAYCATCWPRDSSSGVCLACAKRCHLGHDLHFQAAERFRCDCKRSGDDAGCQCVPPSPAIEPVDIIIGSELTYNLLSCKSLAAVVNRYLKADGVFYEVLSDDRDGVPVFIAEIEALGFETTRKPAPSAFVGNFGTRKWSKQDQESYSMYTWRRRNDVVQEMLGGDRNDYPDME